MTLLELLAERWVNTCENFKFTNSENVYKEYLHLQKEDTHMLYDPDRNIIIAVFTIENHYP